MTSPAKILAFAGSNRKESFNKKLVRIAVEGLREAGAEVQLVDLKDYPMPLYDQDLEAAEGLPDNGKKLKAHFLEARGILIASPEYNSSVTPLLKNTLDWISRPTPAEPSLVAFHGKIVSLISASPSVTGGMRGLVALRSILGNIGVIVLPEQLTIPKAQEAFDEAGALKDPKQLAKLKQLSKTLVETVKRLAG